MTMIRGLAVLFAFASTFADASKMTNYVGNRTTMVHLFEWKWNDVADECERFLGPFGYAGVQVSPVHENVVIGNRPWFERYQTISYHWHTRSGDESEFRAMVRRCNTVGVRVYVDVIFNHMTGNHQDATGTNGSKANTYNLDYPAVPYRKKHFHSQCQVNNYQDPWNVRNCELLGLHDLDQSQEYVREKIVAMLNEMVDAGVAGFRVDAAKHMWPKDLEIIYSRIKDLNEDHGFAPKSRPFIYQEVVDFGNEPISKYEYNSLGAVTEFRAGYELSNSFLGRNPLKWFINWGEPWSLLPSSDSLIFVDNHDTQRKGGDNPLTYKNAKLYKMAVAFMLAHSYGIPRVMSSFHLNNFEQGPPSDSAGKIISPKINPDKTCGNGWVCEHRWRQIYNMVGFKNYVATTKVTNWWDNGSYQIAFCRGNRGFIAINADRMNLKRRMNVCLPAGVYCDVISGEVIDGKCTGKSITVDGSGRADVEIQVGEFDGVAAFHGGAKVA